MPKPSRLLEWSFFFPAIFFLQDSDESQVWRGQMVLFTHMPFQLVRRGGVGDSIFCFKMPKTKKDQILWLWTEDGNMLWDCWRRRMRVVRPPKSRLKWNQIINFCKQLEACNYASFLPFHGFSGREPPLCHGNYCILFYLAPFLNWAMELCFLCGEVSKLGTHGTLTKFFLRRTIPNGF